MTADGGPRLDVARQASAVQAAGATGDDQPAAPAVPFKNIAIVGTGPTGIYLLHHLISRGERVTATLFEAAPLAGVGLPYSPETTSASMLANIASIEIPPLGETYLEWLKRQPEVLLRVYGVDAASLHDRQYLPRLLLGLWFRDALERMIVEANANGHRIALREAARVVDVEPVGAEYRVTFVSTSPGLEAEREESLLFTHVVLATGHDWPGESDERANVFVSPWSGLIGSQVPAVEVGILGTSLSGIDAAMAVACQHGRFDEADSTIFHRTPGSEGLSITLMSRQGLLPEADFWCPLPYRPLAHFTPAALEKAVAVGGDALFDRVWALMKDEIASVDPDYAASVALKDLSPEDFADAYFAPRMAADPFDWAESNLAEVQANARTRRTVEWRYAILRIHEPMQELVPEFTETDRARFDVLKRVFIDNYAAVPPQSIRRLLALHRAGVLHVLALGDEYSLEHEDSFTNVVTEDGTARTFAFFVDARGQRALGVTDLPFPQLRTSLGTMDGPVPMSEAFALKGPSLAGIYLPAAPYLLSRLPFVQGITASCELAEEVARGIFPDDGAAP